MAKMTYFGHATYLFELSGKNIVVDPFFTSNGLNDVAADTIDADYILISHGHFDHIEDAVSMGKRTGAVMVANFEIGNWLGGQGIDEGNISPHHLGGGVQYDFGHVKFTIAHHGSGLPDGSYGGNPAGFLITAEGKKIYLPCDTALFMDMQMYGEEGIDLYVPPIGDRFTMGPDDALRSVKLVKPKMVVPCHYNTFPPIEQDAAAWAVRVESETDAKVTVMTAGMSIDF